MKVTVNRKKEYEEYLKKMKKIESEADVLRKKFGKELKDFVKKNDWDDALDLMNKEKHVISPGLVKKLEKTWNRDVAEYFSDYLEKNFDFEVIWDKPTADQAILALEFEQIGIYGEDEFKPMPPKKKFLRWGWGTDTRFCTRC